MEENIEIVSSKKLLPLHWEILILSLSIAILHYIATIFSLYWTIPWLDIPMHLLGGFIIALISIYALSKIGWFEINKSNTFISLAAVLALTLIVGLTWELWELFAGFSDRLVDLGDTILDIVMDIIGAISAYAYNRKQI